MADTGIEVSFNIESGNSSISINPAISSPGEDFIKTPEFGNSSISINPAIASKGKEIVLPETEYGLHKPISSPIVKTNGVITKVFSQLVIPGDNSVEIGISKLYTTKVILTIMWQSNPYSIAKDIDIG